MDSSVNLYLVGFMGTGKSAVGWHLAQKLGLWLVDSDREIVRREGRSIVEIFCKEGELAFREMERSFVEGGHAESGLVVSCGGGLVMREGMMDALKKRGVVVCLHASAETILERTQGRKHRPLLNTENPLEKIRELLALREPVYRQAHGIVLTGGRPMPEVVDHVLRVYRDCAAEFVKR